MDRSARRAFEAIVRGRVQGVGFRWFVVTTASQLGLSGWVANQADGSVLVLAEGPGQDLELLLAALREGPPGSEVIGVEVVDRPATQGARRFEVRFGQHPGD